MRFWGVYIPIMGVCKSLGTHNLATHTRTHARTHTHTRHRRLRKEKEEVVVEGKGGDVA